MSGCIDPTGDQLKAFMASDLAEPVIMLNLLAFAATATYDPALGEPARSGAEAYGVYSETAQRTIEAVGGRILTVASGHKALIGPPDEWDAVVLVFYPSRQAFLDMIARPDYQAAVHHRTAGLSNTRLIPLPAPAA